MFILTQTSALFKATNQTKVAGWFPSVFLASTNFAHPMSKVLQQRAAPRFAIQYIRRFRAFKQTLIV